MSAPAASSINAPIDPAPVRRRRGRRLVWLLIGLFAGVPILTAGGIWLAWTVQGRAALRREVAVITEADEPLTTAEITAFCRVPPVKRDRSSEWIAALAPFQFWHQNLQSLADGRPQQVPPLATTLQDEASLRKLFAKVQPQLDVLHRLAEDPGVVSYPHDFALFYAITMDECEQIFGAGTALELEFFFAARDGDVLAVKRNLRTRLRMGDTLANDPILMTLLYRLRIHIKVLRDIHQFAGLERDLTDDDLDEFQSIIRELDYQSHVERTLIGERVFLYQAFHYRFANDTQLMQAAIANPISTTHDLGGIWRPEDCALSLRLVNEMLVASREPAPAYLESVRKMYSEIADLSASDAVTRWRFRQTLALQTGHTSLASVLETQAYRDLIDLALALRRYELAYGRWPEQFDALAPQFLPKAPVDPFSGGALLQLDDPDAVTIYSVGFDGRDDGGQCDLMSLEPDIAVIIPRKP